METRGEEEKTVAEKVENLGKDERESEDKEKRRKRVDEKSEGVGKVTAREESKRGEENNA